MWWGSDTLVPRSSPLGDSARLYLRYCISAGTSVWVRASGVSTFGETKELGSIYPGSPGGRPPFS